LKKSFVMSELIIRTENQEALQKIADFLQSLGFEVVFKKPSAKPAKSDAPTSGNGNAGVYTDWSSLAGIWKDNPVTAEELRLKAWGGRI
jgi:hypothetical protein